MVARGIGGAACLVLALVAFSALPFRAGAVILLFLGVGMLFAELFVSHGILAVGGTVFLALGGILLIDRFNPRWFIEPSFGLPISWVLPTAAFLGGAAAYVVVRGAQSRRLRQLGGAAGLEGGVAKAPESVTPACGGGVVQG